MNTHHHHEKTVHHKLAWVVVLTAALFFFYEFIQMNVFNSINTQLREAFNLDAVQIGQFFSMYFYANFLCIFAAGNLLDRYSTKKLLLYAIAVCTIGTFMFSVATQYWVAALGRFLVGSGAAFCFLGCIRLASRWFAPHRMAFVTGVIVTLAMLGGLVAQTPFALLTEYLGSWRQALMINTCLGVVIFFVTMFIVQDLPPDADAQVDAKEDQRHLHELGVWGCIKLAVLNPQNWIGGIYTSLINLPVFVIGGLWGIMYLSQVHHLTTTQASYATTMFFVGVIIGSLLYGWISDRIERRVMPMIVGAFLSLVVMLMLMYIPGLSLSWIIFLFFLVGLVTSSQVLTYPLIAELNPTFITSTAVSIDSVCIMASGFTIPPFFGWLMEKNGTHQLVDGVVSYTTADYNHAMLIMPISFVIALALAFFMRETNCQQQA